MSRHGGRGTDGAYGDGTWLPGGYAAEAEGSTQTSPGDEGQTGPPWGEAGPPWEQPGWDDTGISRPGLDPAGLAGKHPSEPLPSQPPQEGDWPEPPPAFGYDGDAGQEPGYPGTGYPGEAGHTDGGDRGADTGYGYAGYTENGYDHGGYQEADYHAGYDDTGAGFHTGDILDTGTGFSAVHGGFPADGGFADTGTGYVHPDFADNRFTTDTGRYPDDGGYPAGDDGGYPEYGERTAGPPDRDDDHDYPDRGGWYGDTGEQRGWAEDDEGDFLPGMSTGARGGSEGRTDDRGGPGRGRRPGKAGPGKQNAGKARSGKAGTGKAGTSKAQSGKAQGGKARSGKRKRGMRRLAPWLALSVVLALLIGGGGGYFYVYRTYLHPPDFTGSGTGSRIVRIFPGDTAAVVGQRLQSDGVIASVRAFSNAAKISGKGTALEPGYYRVRLHMSAALAFALLLKPSARLQKKITTIEGWRLSQIIAALGRATGDPQGYRKAIKDVAALDLPAIAHGNPEGYLFPATYDIQHNTSPIKMLQLMVTRFGQEAASISLPSAAAHAELTQAQVIVVASLIQAEGGRASDFPKIARVIYNRLNANPQIPLELDSTVMYALHTYGIRASSQQIKFKSPYNTYLHTGLPPGPIDSPGDTAIKAALHPAHGSWTYFVTVDPKTGLTKFTSSFAQFQRYEAELTANIAKGR